MPPPPPSSPNAPPQSPDDKALSLSLTLAFLRATPLPPATRHHLTHTPPSLPDGHGNTPLHWAAFKNATSCVTMLLAHGVPVSSRAVGSGWTALHDAAYSDGASSLQALIAAGADVNAQATSGATPLCFAAQEDAPHAARLLLMAGASPDARCVGQPGPTMSRFSGYSPLHYCGHYNAVRAATVLVEFGAQLEVKDVVGRLPIHVATARGSSDVLKVLLKAGAQVFTEESKGTQTTGNTYFSSPVVEMATTGTGMDEGEEEEVSSCYYNNATGRAS